MKQTKFMQVMFSAVENGDEELTSQVANDIETAKAEGNVDTDEVSYNNLGQGKVLIIDKVNGEATIAEMPEDEASVYDLVAVPEEEMDQYLYPEADGVTPGQVQDMPVEDEHAPMVANAEAPSVEENAGCPDHIDQDDEMGEQHQFSVSSDNAVVQKIFSDINFYDRVFSETIESEETSVIGDLKIEKVDDDTVIVTSESTGDQAKVVLDDDEMEVTELDQKEMSYSDTYQDEPALYSVLVNEDEMAMLQYLFSDSEEDAPVENESTEDTGSDEGPEGYNPLYIVGIDADNHEIVDAPVYSEEDAQELVEHLQEIGIDGVNVFEDPSEAREYASELLQGAGVTISEVEQLAEPEEHEFSDTVSVWTTKFYSDSELYSDFMMRCFSDASETDKIEDAIENGDQVETDDVIITPVDSETAVVEDKNNGEFTKATLDENGVDLEKIDEAEASELTDKEEPKTEEEPKASDKEEVTEEPKAEESKEESPKEEEAPKAEEAKEEESVKEEDKNFSTVAKFFAEAMASQAAAPAVVAELAVPENPDPNAVPVDENGMPLEESESKDAVASVEAIEDKALVAVQSIQAAANDAVMAIQLAKEAPAPQATEDLQEAQFSEAEKLDSNNTLASWLKNI